MQRIAILGGGMGALAAAWALTAPGSPRRDDVEVTLYQLGWRLGGKGASGRNMQPGSRGRIEEHGLHNLFGFYDNTFRMMHACYEELDRPPGSPQASFREAVSPESSAVFMETAPDGTQRPWRILNPVSRAFPGEGDPTLPLWDVVTLAVEMIDLNLRQPSQAPHPDDGQLHPRPALLPLVGAIHAALRSSMAALGIGRRVAGGLESAGASWLASGLRRGGYGLARRGLLAALRGGRAAIWRALRARGLSDDLRRQWIIVNFSTSILIGLLEDDVFHRGLSSINDTDFRQWLTPRAFPDGGLMLDSVLMRVVYDSSFAYIDGDTRIDTSGHAPAASYEAGTLLRGLIQASFQYKGAFGWKLLGGCGDVLIAPLYLVLRARGVKFAFFHRVDALRCGSGPGEPIEAIELTRQTPVRGEYEPLVDFDGLPCWPSEPRYEQLVHGEAIRSSGVELESPTATAPGARRLTLRRGVDFDDVILGISAAALPGLCGDLIAASPRWAAMTAALKTTPTAALQVWTTPDSAGLGLTEDGQPITGFWYSEDSPLNVWADMSHLLPLEGRPGIGHLSYFVSPVRDVGGQEASAAAVREASVSLLGEHVGGRLWPDAASGGGLDWSLLSDPEQRDGVERLSGQYWRANVSPSERYVLSVAGSSAHRLPANLPDCFPNLYLAGDWTDNGLNCGCMEAAVTSGLLAAQAMGATTSPLKTYA